ncbi:MAG: hypothetical protein ABJF23_15075 [Bryobacteraceae bacterium]
MDHTFFFIPFRSGPGKFVSNSVRRRVFPNDAEPITGIFIRLLFVQQHADLRGQIRGFLTSSQLSVDGSSTRGDAQSIKLLVKEDFRVQFPIVCSLLISLGSCLAQQAPVSLNVRSIRVNLTSPVTAQADPVPVATILKAFKNRGINLSLEERFDPATLDRARDTIRDVYREVGRQVRVDYATTHLPPRAVELVFNVIELCPCCP